METSARLREAWGCRSAAEAVRRRRRALAEALARGAFETEQLPGRELLACNLDALYADLRARAAAAVREEER